MLYAALKIGFFKCLNTAFKSINLTAIALLIGIKVLEFS